MREPPLLRVEWVDSVFLENRWRDVSDLPNLEEFMISVGFRMKEQDGFLFLASSLNLADSHLANVIAIPIRAIVKKKRIGH